MSKGSLFLLFEDMNIVSVLFHFLLGLQQEETSLKRLECEHNYLQTLSVSWLSSAVH